jgi:hypothetical protein
VRHSTLEEEIERINSELCGSNEAIKGMQKDYREL